MSKKWDRPIDHWPEVKTAGYASISNELFLHQKELKLDPVDVNIIGRLFSHWWEFKDLPFVSQQSIADQIGMSRRSIIRHLQAMEGRIFKMGPKYRGKNTYDLSPLMDLLTPFARIRTRERNAKKHRVFSVVKGGKAAS